MARLKYVRGRIGFAIFDEGQTHADIARMMHSKPESAGFLTIAPGYRVRENGTEENFVSIHCFGRSSSLDLKSREEDGKYIEEQFNKY